MFESGKIDLGAPVLSFESAVSLDATASASTSYSPVSIISPTYSTQGNQNAANIFNPDLEIVAQQQVTYKN
jgi:hypothetical protein